MKTKIIFVIFIICLFYSPSTFAQKILIIKNDIAENPAKIFNDLKSLSYTVDSLSGIFVTLGLFRNYDVVIISSGVNNNACSSNVLRGEIVNYAAAGGKLIIEGGQIGYNAAIFPFYLGFMNKALHVSQWIADSGGNIKLASQHVTSNLANDPNMLPDSIILNPVNNYMQDVCTHDEYSEVLYYTKSYFDKAGINVFPSVQTPQQIYLAFSYNSVLNHKHAIDLLENCIVNLYKSPIGISSINSLTPEKFQLYQNYPNPFNASSIIRFDISSKYEINVSLKIFDVLGREIETILTNKLSSGKYEIKYNSDNISSGLFFVKLLAGEYTDTKKMIVIK
jgi:hypothetical protein